MLVKRIDNLGTHYWVVLRTTKENAPYFSLFTDGKPSWSKFIWMARQHDTRMDAARTVDLIRRSRRIQKRRKEAIELVVKAS